MTPPPRGAREDAKCVCGLWRQASRLTRHLVRVGLGAYGARRQRPKPRVARAQGLGPSFLPRSAPQTQNQKRSRSAETGVGTRESRSCGGGGASRRVVGGAWPLSVYITAGLFSFASAASPSPTPHAPCSMGMAASGTGVRAGREAAERGARADARGQHMGVAMQSQTQPARLRLFALSSTPSLPAAKIDESKIAICGVRGICW